MALGHLVSRQCKCDCLGNFSTREINVNISNEFNFSDVHVDDITTLASQASGFIHFARDTLWFISP